MRLEALRRLGHTVHSLPRPEFARDTIPRFLGKVSRRLGFPPDNGLNQAILESLAREQSDVLWCDRPLDIKPRTLEAARKLQPSIKVIAYSLDDMAQPHNQSAYYLRSIPLYDLHVTTKSYNIDELKKLGAKRVLFVNNAFCPKVHFPQEVTSREMRHYGGEVGFIGGHEQERAQWLIALARAGVPVRVWGAGWPRQTCTASPNLWIKNQNLWGSAYRLALNCFDINLGFLRKINRDLQTTRSVEIPACGGFMLAERTAEHSGLFREGVEADYFSTPEELIEKVQYYRKHESLRRTIALNGLRRANAVPYTYEAQLKYVLEHLN
jgi:hypothetical protein